MIRCSWRTVPLSLKRVVVGGVCPRVGGLFSAVDTRLDAKEPRRVAQAATTGFFWLA